MHKRVPTQRKHTAQLTCACTVHTHQDEHVPTHPTHPPHTRPPIGPQGAYNQFYEADVRQWRLPFKFNAKPYHATVPMRMSDVAIVHFHGPKPSDYLQYATTGACPKFGDMCKAGVQARACMYTHEWVRRLEGEDAKQAYDLWRAGCAKAS